MTSATQPSAMSAPLASFAGMSERWIKLVFGYLEDRDYANPDARLNDLDQRVAVLLNAYPKQQVDYHFDSDLALRTLKAILDQVPHDACEFTLEPYAREVVPSFQALRDHYSAQPPSVREPFWCGRLLKNDRVVAMITVRNFNHPRAQQPYRGTYTFNIYAAKLDPQKIEEACRTAARNCNAALAGIEAGFEKPKISLLRRLHDFVVYDVEEHGM